MEIQVTRSQRRHRTISARMKNGVMKVSAPAHIPEEHLQKIVERFRLKFERKSKIAELGRNENLARIAEKLNRRYFGGRIQVNSIEYATICPRLIKSIRLFYKCWNEFRFRPKT